MKFTKTVNHESQTEGGTGFRDGNRFPGLNSTGGFVSRTIRFAQSLLVGMRTAVIEMGSHKLRSSLSILGVLLGVASLTAMLSLIGGIDVFLTEKMGQWIGSVWFWPAREPPADELIEWSRSPGLRFSDGSYLERESPDVSRFYRSIERYDKIRIAGRTQNARIRGVTPEILEEDLEHAHVRGPPPVFPESLRGFAHFVCDRQFVSCHIARSSDKTGIHREIHAQGSFRRKTEDRGIATTRSVRPRAAPGPARTIPNRSTAPFFP